MAEMLRAVDEVLENVGAGDRPRLLVLNKADALDDDRRTELAFTHPDGMLISAVTGEGIEQLGERIEEEFRRTLRSVDLLLPYAAGASLAELHDAAGDLERTDTPDGVRIHARLPATLAERYARYAVSARRRQRRQPGVKLAVRRLDPAARLPARAHDDDAGYDLYALEAATLAPGERAMLRTGIAIELPPGHAGLVLPRSGLAARHGIAIVNAPGLIDAGYRGELKVLLLNTDRDAAFEVAPGDRIAQLVDRRGRRAGGRRGVRACSRRRAARAASARPAPPDV